MRSSRERANATAVMGFVTLARSKTIRALPPTCVVHTPAANTENPTAASGAAPVKKKGRKKKASAAHDVRAEVAGWRGKLADAANEELVGRIEQLVDTLGAREPALSADGPRADGAVVA